MADNKRLNIRFDMNYRFATSDDANALALMNQQFIRDEGHRNSMNLVQLTERMAGWLGRGISSGTLRR